MNKQFVNTEIEDLTRRSQNIIGQLRGVETLLLFYKKYKSFLSIPNVGISTNEELISFCDYLINRGDIEPTDSNLKEEQEIPDIEKCLAIYENEKPRLGARTINGLNKIEEQYNFNISTENKTEFIKKLFFSNFDLSHQQNMGLKSKSEFEFLKGRVVNCVWNNEEHGIGDLKIEIRESKNETFLIYLNEKERQEMFIGGRFLFRKMICVFLLSTDKIKERVKELLINRFFCEIPLERMLLAKKLECSLERIRQIDIYICKSTIPWAVNAILEAFKTKPYELPENNNSDILFLDNFSEFIFRGNNYTPNVELSKSVYSFMLKKNYGLIDDLIQHGNKSFEIPASYFFISKKFIKETELINLLGWIDDQIYQFEIVAFEYRLEVLIKRFYSENQKDISEKSLQSLYSIISAIKKERFELDEGALKKIARKSHIDSVLNEVYLFLKEKNEGQMTNAILEHLDQKNLGIEKDDLLRYLNSHKSTFTSFGLGNWTLLELNNNNETLSGSFREIVRNLLSKRTDPIHISELYEYINSLKKVSLASMMSNLRSETEGTFKFFNCSYIGLSEKEYSQYWSEIPKIKPVHIKKKALSNYNGNQHDFVSYISSKYGYPKQHVNFILDCRSGKYY